MKGTYMYNHTSPRKDKDMQRIFFEQVSLHGTVVANPLQAYGFIFIKLP